MLHTTTTSQIGNYIWKHQRYKRHLDGGVSNLHFTAPEVRKCCYEHFLGSITILSIIKNKTKMDSTQCHVITKQIFPAQHQNVTRCALIPVLIDDIHTLAFSAGSRLAADFTSSATNVSSEMLWCHCHPPHLLAPWVPWVSLSLAD